jgi:Rod binding domain-containing protein
MNPISGFQLGANGRFEARHLEAPDTARKLIEGATDTATPNAAHAAQGAPKQKVDPKLEKVAHEFEAIFLRNLLKPLEEAGSVGKQASVSSGSGVYGSMMVGALADSASQGGGIGLAHLVLEALTRGAATQKTSK